VNMTANSSHLVALVNLPNTYVVSKTPCLVLALLLVLQTLAVGFGCKVKRCGL
jgi:hypothetical protein